MNEKSLLIQFRPRSSARWRDLPIVGPLLDDFLLFLSDQGYAVSTISNLLGFCSGVVSWLQRQGISTLVQMTQHDLQIAYGHFRRKQQGPRWAILALTRFFNDRHLVPDGEAPAQSPTEVEVATFATYLRETRGLAEATIQGHVVRLRPFLEFLRIDQDPSQLQRVQMAQVEAFLCRSARTNNRFSLQHIVATVRAYLRRRHAQGLISRPLHLQIDSPRVYRGERFPRALPWTQVLAFVQSIDRSDPFGRRDFTILYLAAAYGLRSGELVRLTLDDIDWRHRTLHVMQTKTRQTLQLPLTDEAANVLIDYLRKARPQSPHRQLFLRMRAPAGPLQPTAVHDILEYRLRCSGLNLGRFGTHVMRHSFATRLMHQGVSIKAIGDTLGHRDIESTSVYLRLNLEDLCEAALPVPATSSVDSIKLVPVKSLLPIRPARRSLNLPAQFQSRFAPSLRRFVELKRALGSTYRAEATILAHWDAFIHRQYPGSGKVRSVMFTEWAKTLVNLTSTGKLTFQRNVRNFLLFHARDHAGTFIPDRLAFPKAAPVISPRLISESEMGRVLAAAAQLPPSADNPLRAETFRIGLILLFCCGLRRGELFRLVLGDIEQEQAVLRIRVSKFRKSRLLPLAPTVTLELRQYLQKRQKAKLPMASEAFLMWSRQRSPEVYAANGVGPLWRQLCTSAQVLNDQGRPPRIHDLRHSYAVSVLQRWYAQGLDVQAKLPHLACYLGHVSPVSTHHYLKLTPELRRAASQLFHERFAPLLTGGVA